MLRVVRSNRSEDLVAPLADVLRDPVAGPFEQETVVVGADGVGRWLEKQLAQQLGVCARVRFLFAGTLIKEITHEVVDAPAPDEDPWRPEALQWAILSVLPSLLDTKPFEPLRSYLTAAGEASGVGGINAFQLARKIAGTFSRYVSFRPEMVRLWDDGGAAGAQGEPWQPLLWRALRNRLDAPHPAEVTSRFLGAMSAKGFTLPRAYQRLCLFGVSSLPPAQMQVLAGLAEHADVRVFAVTPSPASWERTRQRRTQWRGLALRDDGACDPVPPDFEGDHPLLASLGRIGREFQVLLERNADYEEADLSVAPTGDRLLARVQRDIFSGASKESGSAPTSVVHPHDTSVSIHACHGEMRQVEVLQDQLLDLFQNNPDLKPSDVLVLTPDVETFAPLIDAVFQGQAAAGRLPVRVAGRTQRSENPLCDALLRVLSLAGSRLKATAVLDVLGLAPIQRRFELDDDAVGQISGWVRDAQIRWGVDAEDRAQKGQPAFDLNTWEWGLDRLLLGYAMPGAGRDMFGGRLPFDEVEGSDALVLGRFAEFCSRLFGHLRTLVDKEQSLARWARALRDLVTDLMSVDDDDAPLQAAVDEALDALQDRAAAAGFDGDVAFEVPRAVLEHHFDESRAARSLLTGSITVVGMVPLRSIGYRVVCLLGLDDGTFPRGASGAGFDLSARRAALGDRTPREDDRYLFLEALLAARTHLRIFYSGQSLRDNKPLPPSVAVSELLDDVCARYRLPPAPDETEEGARARLAKHLVVRHPLQPFSARYFGASDDPRLFSYASGYLEGARALATQTQGQAVFWDGGLAAAAAGVSSVSLWEVERFFAQPIAGLLRQRLGLWYARGGAPGSDREPLLLNGLEKYQVGANLLDQALAGIPLEQATEAALRSGALPPGTPGEVTLAAVLEQVDAVKNAVLAARGGAEPLAAVEVDVALGGLRLDGHVPGLWPGGQVMHHYATVKAKHLLSLWLRHLALHAAGPKTSSDSVIVNGFSKPPRYTAAAFGSLEQAEARARLAELLGLYVDGQSFPLLLLPETSLAYAKRYRKEVAKKGDESARRDARSAAAPKWHGNSFGRIAGDKAEPAVARVLGDAAPFASDYVPPGGRGQPGRDFHSVALLVFDPLLAAQREVEL